MKQRFTVVRAALGVSLVANLLFAAGLFAMERVHDDSLDRELQTLDSLWIVSAVSMHLRPGMPRAELVRVLQRQTSEDVRITVFEKRVVANSVVFELDVYGRLLEVEP